MASEFPATQHSDSEVLASLAGTFLAFPDPELDFPYKKNSQYLKLTK